MAKAYYNEFKPEAVAMLRELIANKLIADGDVDDRPIQEVTVNDLKGYTQCHFFAGIGGWSVALRLAGWSDDKPVWTGSCPCQPFSSAGKRKGINDERHLWPYWFNLIKECRPAIIFGEQVNTAITHGWLDDVANDLEEEGYACAAAVLPACSVNAPHKRDRLWFVGDSEHIRSLESAKLCCDETYGNQRWPQKSNIPEQLTRASRPTDVSGLHRCTNRSECHTRNVSINVADSECIRQQRQGEVGKSCRATQSGFRQASKPFYDSASIEQIDCPDGKQRFVKSGVCLLANGVQHRASILHALGNAIVPQVAQKFIQAYQEIISGDNND